MRRHARGCIGAALAAEPGAHGIRGMDGWSGAVARNEALQDVFLREGGHGCKGSHGGNPA